MAKKNELTFVSDGERTALAETFNRYSGMALAEMNGAEKALALSEATIALRDAFTPAIMNQIMSLMDKPYGFKTDRSPGTKEFREKGSYDEEVVKDVMISGVLYDLRPTGNEINIIARGMYATKEAFTRKLKEMPGLSDLQICFGIPKMLNGGAIVECRATWLYNGVTGSIGIRENDKCEIPVRVNSMMGTDAILGKAERKLRKRIFDRVTGTESTIPEGDAGEVIIETGATIVEPSEKAQKLMDELQNRRSPKKPENQEEESAAPEPTEEELAQAEERKAEQKAKLEQAPVDYEKKSDEWKYLSRLYDTNPEVVDEVLAELGMSPLCEIVYENLDDVEKNKIKRSAAKCAKKLSE